MGNLTLGHFLTVSAILFVIGMLGVLTRRNVLLIFMSVEMMLNAVNLSLIAFGRYLDSMVGQVFAVFVITIAAAELGLGLAIVLRVYRMRTSVNVDEIDLMRW